MLAHDIETLKQIKHQEILQEKRIKEAEEEALRILENARRESIEIIENAEREGKSIYNDYVSKAHEQAKLERAEYVEKGKSTVETLKDVDENDVISIFDGLISEKFGV